MNQKKVNGRTILVRVMAVILAAGLTLMAGCPAKPTAAAVFTPPQPAQGGAKSIGVVILIDTSGSMKSPVADRDGRSRPKHELASEALSEILRQAGDWAKAHGDRPFNLSIQHFSGSAHPVLNMGRFDHDTTQQAVNGIPKPDGGTAIGLALQAGWNTLKPVQAEKQYILCITDGENRDGPEPQTIAPQVYEDSGKKVEIHFIAFDVRGDLFEWVKQYNGSVVSASNKEQLDKELKRIFSSRILAE
jgi:hypothetical protein